MLTTKLINALQVLSRSGKPLISSDASQPISKLAPGQAVQGSVEAPIKAGLFSVLVAGQTLQMQLPTGTRAGDLIQLRVLTNEPNLSFALETANPLLSSHEQLGTTARLLATLAQQNIAPPPLQQATGAAIWSATDSAPDSQQLATALRDALANSGLFYESHQAQWVGGERSTAQLLIEPQNQLLSPNNTPTDSPTARVTNEAGIAKELLPLLQQQLHTLETHQLTWTGQVWPEQSMQWEIQGQPEHQADSADSRQWRTEMELALPNLGDVHAKLVFSAQGLTLQLQAADAHTLALFKQTLAKLQASLASVDIELTSTAIEQA
jgi:hypothetical protein